MKFIWIITPIVIVSLAAVYFIWAVKKREKRYSIEKEIIKSGNRGEYKVQAVLRALENPKSRYRVYHNIRLGPDAEHTNEYDTVILGPNGIFHIETKNYGGERGGIIDIDSQQNWILHKKSGYSKLITNPSGQVDSHEYRLQGFLNRVVGIKKLPTQGIIVLSCDDITLRFNTKTESDIPILSRHELVPYIKSYNQGKVVLYPRTIKKICKNIEAMNRTAKAN
ncbi:nuclease-related domain-containing protein [Syntrophomonas erecta]